MKAKLVVMIEVDVEYEEKEYPSVTPEMVANGLFVEDDDVVDGFDVSTLVEGCNNMTDFFMSGARIVGRSVVSVDSAKEAK